MPADTPLGRFTWMDDFLDDNGFVNATDASAARWYESATTATQDLRAGHGGWWRMTVGTSQTDACSLISMEAMAEVDEGETVVLEGRIRTSDADKSSIFFGFTDARDDEVIIENEDSTINTVATNAFGFLLEGEQDGAAWTVMGVEGDTDKTQAVIPITRIAAAADSTTYTLRLEASSAGSGTVRAFVNGKLGTTLTNYFDSSNQWFVGIGADGRGTAYNVDIDYIKLTGPRGDAPS